MMKNQIITLLLLNGSPASGDCFCRSIRTHTDPCELDGNNPVISPALLLAVDAQPDGTVGIKRFWKGNFLFNTSDVVGEPGFKAFRPIVLKKDVPFPMKNKELTSSAGFAPYSLQQRKMKTDLFYHTMDRLINPEPLDPETALLDQIQALYEQLYGTRHFCCQRRSLFQDTSRERDPYAFQCCRNLSGRWPMGRLFNSQPRSQTIDCNGCGARFSRPCCPFAGGFQNLEQFLPPNRLRKNCCALLDQKGIRTLNHLYPYKRFDTKTNPRGNTEQKG